MEARARAHPARGILAVEGRLIRDVAWEAGYCPAYVGRVLARQLPLTAEFRRRLSRVLGRPESELFDSATP